MLQTSITKLGLFLPRAIVYRVGEPWTVLFE